MKTTIDLPDDLVREIKLRAVHQRRTVKDLVAEFIRQRLGMPPLGRAMEPPRSSMVTVGGSNGLPVIPCVPNAPATRLSVKELLALEQDLQTEEDLKRARFPL